MSDGSLHSGWFYLPVDPQDHWSEWIKAKQTSRDTLDAWGDTVMEGGGEGGSALCWGDGEKPREVPVWRENHVKATDGSLRGLCKQGKKQKTEHTVRALFQGFRGNICRLFSFWLPLIHLQCLSSRGFQDRKMNWFESLPKHLKKKSIFQNNQSCLAVSLKKICHSYG